MRRADALKAVDANFCAHLGRLFEVACADWGNGVDKVMMRYQAGLIVAMDIHERATAVVTQLVSE